MKNLIFYVGIATLFTHELDAIANHEWRVLPLTSGLSEELGFALFLLAHIPLFAILIALVASTNGKIRAYSRIGISIFLIIHGLLHALFMGTRAYEFATLSSNILIFGGALFGIIHLSLEYIEKKSLPTAKVS